MKLNDTNKGFTLIELLVVISIIGLLSAVVMTSLNSAKAKARDSIRKQDLLQIKQAIDLYYADNGSYPLPSPGGWSGAHTGAGVCGPADSLTYIAGIVPTYRPSLPVDPIATASCTGYLYHSDGTNYKILIHNSYEGVYPTIGQPWYDPARPTWALMLCSGEPACSSW